MPVSRLAGTHQDTVAVVSPGMAVTLAGACGPASTGTRLWVAAVSPSWPQEVAPQQWGAPAASTAQALYVPALTWVRVRPASTPLVSTATGTVEPTVLPSPSSPSAL